MEPSPSRSSRALNSPSAEVLPKPPISTGFSEPTEDDPPSVSPITTKAPPGPILTTSLPSLPEMRVMAVVPENSPLIVEVANPPDPASALALLPRNTVESSSLLSAAVMAVGVVSATAPLKRSVAE